MKAIVLFVLTLALLAAPVYAQRQEHGGGNRRGGQHAQQQHRGDDRAFRGDHDRERGHFDGRHFDADYRGRYFGRGHVFVCSPFGIDGGWGFYYGGFQFDFEEWPVGWAYSDGVYVDEGPDGAYYMYNPFYPGAHVGLTIVF